MLRNFELVAEAAGVFVERLLPADKARIGSFSDRIQVDPREFTSNKDELRAILKTELQPPGPTPLWNAVGVGMTALLHQQGRRVVLVFTDGMDSPLNGSPNNVTRRTGSSAPRGRRHGLRHRPRWGMPFEDSAGTEDSADGHGGGGGRAAGQAGSRLESKAASGGGYFELTSTGTSSTFGRIADELTGNIWIGFVPQKLTQDAHPGSEGEGGVDGPRRKSMSRCADRCRRCEVESGGWFPSLQLSNLALPRATAGT